MKKKIEIKRKESQKNYFDDIKKTVESSTKEDAIRKSILVHKSLDNKIKDFIYKKRTNGDIYYTQTKLITEAIQHFLNDKENI